MLKSIKNSANYQHPFGMLTKPTNFQFGSFTSPEKNDSGLMKERSYTSNTYRFGFNSQEKDDEIFKGTYSAEFWEYDGRLGRRWNKDPVVKTHESPYAAFANNPIWVVDKNGADTSFADADNHARNDFIGAMKDLDNRIEKTKSLIDNLRNKSTKKGWSEKKFQRKLNRAGYERTLVGLKEVRGTFDKIIKSSVMFEYTTNSTDFKNLQNGNTSTWSDGKKVSIDFRVGHLEALVHENRHGLGILLHEIGYNEGADYQNEKEAFRHQRIYDAASVLNDMYNAAKEQFPNTPERWSLSDIEQTIKWNYMLFPGYTRDFIQIKAENSPYPLLTP